MRAICSQEQEKSELARLNAEVEADLLDEAQRREVLGRKP
jgi:hypothetical protein